MPFRLIQDVPARARCGIRRESEKCVVVLAPRLDAYGRVILFPLRL